MDQLEKDIAILERYIENDISDQEKKEVKARLSTEVEFRSLLIQLKELILGIKYTGRQEILAHLEQIEANLPPIILDDNQVAMVPDTTPSVSRKWWVGIAASVLIIFTVGVLYLSNGSKSMDELYADNFGHYPNLVETITRGELDIESQRKMAFMAYENQDYEQAALLLSTLPDEEKDSSILLYMGISYMFIDKDTEAIQSLEAGLQSGGEYQDQIKWYLGLSYLKVENKEKAIALFEEISASEYSKKEEAKAILESLVK